MASIARYCCKLSWLRCYKFWAYYAFFTQVILDWVVVEQSLKYVCSMGLLLFGIGHRLAPQLGNTCWIIFPIGWTSPKSSRFCHASMMLYPRSSSRARLVTSDASSEAQKLQLLLAKRSLPGWMPRWFCLFGADVLLQLKLTRACLNNYSPIVILTLVATPLMQRISKEIFKARRSHVTLVGTNADRSRERSKTAAWGETYAGDGKICLPAPKCSISRSKNSVTDWM